MIWMVAAGSLAGSLAVPSGRAEAAVSSWQKGATIFQRWNTDFSSDSFRQSVKNLQATGANYVVLQVVVDQTNDYSTDVHIGSAAPTDQSLNDGINFIHSLGMHVTLKIEDAPDDGTWSGNVNPSDRTTWFNNYNAIAAHYAQIAQATGVEEYVIAEELPRMSQDNQNSTNTQNWLAIIANVRKLYSGKITYSANWDGEYNGITFWSALDQIGVSAYFDLYGDNSVANLESQWNNWNTSTIKPLSDKWGKPILFTEVGYKTLTTANQNPWQWWQGGSVDMQAQANDYQALFDYWNNYSYLQGVYLWNWSSDPNAGGPGDTDYTPQNKTAQSTMTTWFSQGGGGGGGIMNPPGTFSASASANPANPAAGQSTAFAVNVANNGGTTSGETVDIEIYNSSNAQVFQKFFQNQTFSANGTQTYNVNWTPGTAGTYTLKTGVFSGDWSIGYYWGNSVLGFAVGSSGGTGGGGISTGASVIDLWWPTDGSNVSGVQPFKALLENTPLSNYTMYWQVDGDMLNQMADNQTDYPHKEADVDVAPWNWNGNGPYTINFVAKDVNGNIVTQKSAKITVTH